MADNIEKKKRFEMYKLIISITWIGFYTYIFWVTYSSNACPEFKAGYFLALTFGINYNLYKLIEDG